MPVLNTYIDYLEQNANLDRRAEGQSFKIDRNLNRCPQRWAAIIERINTTYDRMPAVQAAMFEYKRHIANDVMNPAGRTPVTFDPVQNAGGIVPHPDSERTLVRLEPVNWILLKSEVKLLLGLSGVELKDILIDKSKRDEISNKISKNFRDAFISQWNKHRDNRPMFAAFYDQIENDADSNNWLPLLRSRLGLGHIGPDETGPQLVFQMRYTVDEVLSAAPSNQEDNTFAIPTVLDIQINPCFFPAPQELDYGRALALEARPNEVHAAEILHWRLPYKAEHIARIDWMDYAAPVADLLNRRNEHLDRVRIESGNGDFGHPLA